MSQGRLTLFLSYSRLDTSLASKIYKDLSDNGFNVFFDTEKIDGGQAWESRIKAAIDTVDYFIPLFTENSYNNDGYFHTEVKHAIKRFNKTSPVNKFIIPCALVKEQFIGEYETLNQLHIIDFTDYSIGINKLRHTIVKGGETSQPLTLELPIKKPSTFDHAKSLSNNVDIDFINTHLGLDDLITQWVREGNSHVSIETHFLKDAEFVLNMATQKHHEAIFLGKDPVWIDGTELLRNHNPYTTWQWQLEESETRICLLDCSSIGFSLTKGFPAEGLRDNFENLLQSAQKAQVKLLISMTVGAAKLLYDESTPYANVERYKADRLFSIHYRQRAIEILNKIFEIPKEDSRLSKETEVLVQLLSVNSTTLYHSIHDFLSQKPGLYGLTYNPETPVSESNWFSLSQRLTENGFYEIAFRIEVFFKSLEKCKEFVELDFDYESSKSRIGSEKHKIIGKVRGVDQIPFTTSKAIMVGRAGTGKSTTITQIAQKLALPSLDKNINPIGIYCTAQSTADISIENMVIESIKTQRWIHDSEGNQSSLPCFEKLAHAYSLDDIRMLFSSPLYIMIDDIDKLDFKKRPKLETEVRALKKDRVLVVSRNESISEFNDYPQFRVRKLTRTQFNTLIVTQEDSPSLEELLSVPTSPIALYIRNPFVLKIISELNLKTDHLKEAAIAKTIKQFIERALGKISDPNEKGSVEQELKKLADFKLRDTFGNWIQHLHEEALHLADKKAELIDYDAEQKGIRFRHDLFQDYFVAKHIVDRLDHEEFDSSAYMDALKDIQPEQSTSILKLIVGLLNTSKADALISEISKNNSNLALECLLEIPRNVAQQLHCYEQVVHSFLPNSHENDHELRVKKLKSLSYLDPRLKETKTLSNMIPIEGREGSFMMGRYPVTNLEYERYVKAKKVNPAPYSDHPEYNYPNYPVVGISFFEASNYCEWLSTRHPSLHFSLPSPHEWDLAAFGSDVLPNAFAMVLDTLRQDEGQQIKLLRLQEPLQEILKLHKKQLETEKLFPVGAFNPSVTGCYDMLGSVWEWCDSLVSLDSQSKNTNSGGDLNAVVKGRKWSDTTDSTWTLIGGSFAPDLHFHQIGFRVCCKIIES